MLKRVVARVAMPDSSSAAHARSPSTVLGILMQILSDGKLCREVYRSMIRRASEMVSSVEYECMGLVWMWA